MTEQDRVDAAEAAAVERYLAMRAVWWPCWGAAGRVASRVPKCRRPAS